MAEVCSLKLMQAKQKTLTWQSRLQNCSFPTCKHTDTYIHTAICGLAHIYTHTYGCVHAKSLSCVTLFETLWTVALQAPLSVGFSRQEYWSGLLFPSPGDLPNSETEGKSLPSALAGRLFTTSTFWEAPHTHELQTYFLWGHVTEAH